MILTVTLNAAVDKTFRIEGFTLDRVHRPSSARIVAGGKGVNAARVHQTLGGVAVTTGFLGGYNGRFIARSLHEEGVRAHFVQTKEESRVCIAVIDPLTNSQTEINEIGPNVTRRELTALRNVFRSLTRENSFSFCAFCGSAPPGVPPAIYAELIAIAREQNLRCVLDTSGDALKAGVEARPWMLKPNLRELSDLTGNPLDSPDAIITAAQSLCRSGIEIVAVTMGARGCIMVIGARVWGATPPEVEFVSAVGSGDSFLGAFLWAVERELPEEEALRLAVGAGTANAAVYGAGFCSMEAIREIAGNVIIERLA